MKEEDIKNKIKEIEKLLEEKITVINYDYQDRLLDMHKKFWDFLYFKKNQEETFLIK